MKNIEIIGLTEMTYAESLETEGGFLPAILAAAAIFAVIGGCIGVIAFGYWVGKCVL